MINNKFKSSLGGCRQKPIGALDSAKIGERGKPTKFQKSFLENWWGLERASKNDKNEYKSSLGGCGRKPIGAMDWARIGEKVAGKNSNFLSGKV
jgi:hypothetical protein